MNTTNSNNKFIPTKDMWYVYFSFYNNSDSEIQEFKDKLNGLYDFILGFIVEDEMFNSKKLIVYTFSKAETEKLKNDTTLKLYKKCIGENGQNVF